MPPAPAAGQPPDYPQIKVVSNKIRLVYMGAQQKRSWASNNVINLAGESLSEV